MFGKIFGSMYEGSLVGKGALAFAVMGYAIAKAYPVGDRMQVTLNPHLIAASLGEPFENVRLTIEFLCSPDPESTTKDEEGRRLVKIGSFEYWLVNGMKYRSIRDEEKRREQVRTAVSVHRQKRKKKSPPVVGQTAVDIMSRNGASAEEIGEYADRVNDEIRKRIQEG